MDYIKVFKRTAMLVFCLLVLLIPANDSQAHMIELSPEELWARAENVIVGDVMDITYTWDNDKRLIYTYVTVKVVDETKGKLTSEEIKVLTEGGVKEDPDSTEKIWLWSEYQPVFWLDEIVVLYLTPLSLEFLQAKGLNLESEVYALVGDNQGKMTYGDFFAGKLKAIKEATFSYNFSETSSTPVITSISPNAASAGTDSLVTVRGSGFGAAHKNKDFMFYFRTGTLEDGTRGRRFMPADLESWSDTRIEAVVPTARLYHLEPGDRLYNYAAASGPVAVRDAGDYLCFYPFTSTFGYMGQFWDDNKIEFYVSTEFSEAEINAIVAAANTWSDAAEGVQFVFKGYASDNSVGRNKENLVTMEDMFDSEGNPSSTIGRARIWISWLPWSNKIVEADFAFNSLRVFSALPEEDCEDDAFDMQTVAVHEFGHWLHLTDLYGNLGHPHHEDRDKIMFGFGTTGSVQRDLHLHDVLAIQWIYDFNRNPNAFGTIRVIIGPEKAVEAGARWSLEGDTNWYNSGDVVQVVPGEYTITFNTLDAWFEPDDTIVSVVSGQAVTEDFRYDIATGGLSVRIEPSVARSAGAQWSIDGGATWHNHTIYHQYFPIGNYTIIFKNITGWQTPSPINITITKDSLNIREGTYEIETYEINVSAHFRSLFADGEVEIITGERLYDYYEIVTVSATPTNDESYFLYWTDEDNNRISNKPRYSFRATQNLNLVAHFDHDHNLNSELHEWILELGPILENAHAYQGRLNVDPEYLKYRIDAGNIPHGKLASIVAALNWPGSELKLSLYDPDDNLIVEESSDEPPIILIVNNAAEGDWKVKVTPVDLPYDEDYPYAVLIGEHYVLPAERVTRLSGANRYATAVDISQDGWDSANTVVLARGDDYADALAGVPLAYQLDAPILLTPTAALHEATEAEIERLGATNVILLGGTAAISDNVRVELEAMGLTVERISGVNRYHTAVRIAYRLKNEGVNFDTAFIAVGTNFADALAASSYAAMRGEPILLTGTNTLPDATSDALNNLGIENTYVCGGTAAVSSDVFGELPKAKRIFGANRYATALALAEEFLPGGATHVAIATGLNFPDAIAGGVWAAKYNTGILLVDGKASVPGADLVQFFETKGIEAVTLFGGSGVVSSAMEAWFEANLGD